MEEFAAEMGVSVETMKSNWERVVPKLLQYYKEHGIPCIDQGTLGKFNICNVILHHQSVVYSLKRAVGRLDSLWTC